jgi:hypothetical protein
MTIGRIIQEITGGRPYVFVIMPYEEKGLLFKHIKSIIDPEFRLACIRADDVHATGHDLLAKINLLIERSELVIADISTKSPNVFYEVGYAVGVKKKLILLARRRAKVPTDLKGMGMVEYDDTPDGATIFEKNLRGHLKVLVNSQIALLRDMLEADITQPAYILSNPKYPGVNSRILGQVYDTKTFGDNLGILGLLSAFGSIMGEGRNVELISAQHSPPSFAMQYSGNLYLIGSDKVNPVVKTMLHRLQKVNPVWKFGPLPGKKAEGDYRNVLYRIVGGKEVPQERKTERRGKNRSEVVVVDHGLLVRGPHPYHPGRIVLIMSGAHSLGTGAASLAATRTPLIQEVKNKLQEVKTKLPEEKDIANKRVTFWALVRATASTKDCLLSIEGVKVLEAGVIE